MKNDLTQAKGLIAECLHTQNTYLDLGNCGITDLTDLPELFECKHIETLILSSGIFLKNDYKFKSQNKGKTNCLQIIPSEITKFQNLKKTSKCHDINW